MVNYILVLSDTPVDRKSLLIAAGAATLGAIVFVGYKTMRRYMVIGPYPSAICKSAIARGLQRRVQDITRRDLACSWFVGESLINRIPTRQQNNGHAAAGAVRDEARELITATISAQGWKKIEISPNRMLEGDYGIVQHYSPADLTKPVTDDIFEDWSVVVGIDVDYYIEDLDKYLEFGKPAIFHTFNPLKVSGFDGDCRYRIMDNRVKYEVGGGGDWSHEVWDWCAPGEFIRVECGYQWYPWLMRKLGFQKVVYFKVYHARPWVNAPDRALVWLIPQTSNWELRWIDHDMHTRKLGRVKYQDKHRKGWNRIVHNENGQPGAQLMVSLGREGEDANATIKKVDYDMLMGLDNSQSVSSRMIALKYTCPITTALMGQYFKGNSAYVPDCTSIVASNVLVHWPYSAECDVPEVSSRAYAKPLVDNPNLMPMTKRWEIMSMCLEHRVSYVKNKTVPSQSVARLAQEFLELVVPEMGQGIPFDIEDTAAMLSKPSQQLAIKQIWDTLDIEPRRLIESFVKNEPTNKNGRIISSFPDARFLLRFSQFTLAFRDQVLHAEHNKHWFCPGLSPVEIANKVRDYYLSVEGIIEGDYSNFDGRVSAWLQKHVMNAAYHRYFRREYSKELHSYTDMLIKCPARAKNFGFKYDSGVGVKSGSPTTCDLNTILNAFLMYAAVRKTNPMATKEEAFASIGLAFGDDSLFERQYKQQWVRLTEQVGMALKVEVCKPDTGVCFLARVFPDLENTNTSFQDPLRTWRKLHITNRDPNVPLEDAARDRLEGYLVTDGLTPLTSDYCKMVIRCFGKENERSLNKRLSRKDRLKEKPYWLTNGGSWPQSVEDVLLMLQCISHRTGVDDSTLRIAIAQCNNTTDLWAGPQLHDTPRDYADGILPDGTPSEPVVDVVLVEEQRNVNNSRATSGGEGQYCQPTGGHARSHVNCDRPPRSRPGSRDDARQARPAELPILPGQPNTQSPGSNQRNVGQARNGRNTAGNPRRGGSSQHGVGENTHPGRQTRRGGRGQKQEPPAAGGSRQRPTNGQDSNRRPQRR
nr:MAG: nodavirus polyprotein (domains: methyltransferase, RdRP, long-distance movement protein) [Koper noda-like virus 1]